MIKFILYIIFYNTKCPKTKAPLIFTLFLKTLHHKIEKQAQLGVPHSRIQVELGFILQAGTCLILNFAQNPRQSQIVQGKEMNLGGGTLHRKSVYREVGTP